MSIHPHAVQIRHSSPPMRGLRTGRRDSAGLVEVRLVTGSLDWYRADELLPVAAVPSRREITTARRARTSGRNAALLFIFLVALLVLVATMPLPW